MLEKPIIKTCREIACSRLFRIEELQLRFSNGVERTYERLGSFRLGHQAVMIVPLLNNNRFLMIREYASGTENYQLTLPKGLVELGEKLIEGGNRELKEEVGYGARQWKYLSNFTVSPNYMQNHIHTLVALDLYEAKIPGDEPEPLEVIEWSFNRLLELNDRPDFSEARTLASLFLVREKLQTGWLGDI